MKSIALAVVAGAITVVAPVGGTLTAGAASASCSVDKQTIEEWSADRHRVRIKCSEVKGGVARGLLPISGEGDSVSPWFFTTGTYYYGEYKEAWNWQLGTPYFAVKS
jgi:hypothetical protein